MLHALAAAAPLTLETVELATKRTGLLVVDIVHGFCTPGRGPLAPFSANPQVERMIDETDRLARRIGPKLVFRDSHFPGQNEAPYPRHCEQGTGDDELVDKLAWLEGAPETTVMPKECINGVVGGIRQDGGNIVFDWARESDIERLVVTGICTDICVLTAVTTLLSARTRGFLGRLTDIVVYEPGCATYDLPLETARQIGLPESTAHPQELFHRMGLLVMQNQGAVIAGTIA